MLGLVGGEVKKKIEDKESVPASGGALSLIRQGWDWGMSQSIWLNIKAVFFPTTQANCPFVG